MSAKQDHTRSTTNILWGCPVCGSHEVAQVNRKEGDPDDFPSCDIPRDRYMVSNPPCSNCGGYRLTIPDTTVSCLPVRVLET
jgi:hypothetical protein